MTLEKQLHNARIVSSVAATVISLACGTNVSAHCDVHVERGFDELQLIECL